MSTLLKMQKIHPLCSRCIRMYPLQNRWTVLRYLQCYENFSECCTHLILPETALFSPTPTFAKEPFFLPNNHVSIQQLHTKILISKFKFLASYFSAIFSITCRFLACTVSSSESKITTKLSILLLLLIIVSIVANNPHVIS